MLKVYALLDNQTFVRGLDDTSPDELILTQNNDQPLRIYLLKRSRTPGGVYPFTTDPLSGAANVQCVASLRDVSAFPATIGSTAVLAVIRDGFSGIFHLNTAEIAAYLAGVPERQAAFCIDIIDTAGNKLSPFRRLVTLRAIDMEATVSYTSPSLIYLPGITGYTGGGATNADGITSVDRAIGTVFMFWVDGTGSQWRLEAGTADTDLDAGIIKLLDSGLNLVRGGGI